MAGAPARPRAVVLPERAIPYQVLSPLFHLGRCCQVIAVPETQAFEIARRAGRAEGIFHGPSTGANLIEALTVAQRLGLGHRVVSIQGDSGLKFRTGRNL